MALSERGRLVLGIIGDISVIIIIGGCSILMRQLATPFHRGFFLDDESLMYPFKDSTIVVSLLYGVGFTLPSLVIMIIEAAWLWLLHMVPHYMLTKKAFFQRWLWNVYRMGLMFYFGVVVTHFSTNVPKYTIGRLRPHFFAVCAPNVNETSDFKYIEDAHCTSQDTGRIKEARVSFPSGHSSMAIYCMLFLVLYLQRRFTWKGMVLLKPLLQTVCILMGFYVCLTRVSDYKHHWSDVLAGGILGAIVAGFVFWSLQKDILIPIEGSGNNNAPEQGMFVDSFKENLSYAQNESANSTSDLNPVSTAL